MNPTEYADQELHKTTEALLAMEQRMRNAKMAKEAAVDRASPAEALRQLHAEIDFGNDLLLLNKARMLLVSMHNEDVMELREVTLRCINAAQETSGQVQQRIAQLLPRLDHDKAALAESKIALEDEVHVLESKEQDAQRELKMQMEQVEDEEKQIWKEILNSLNKIQESATRKVKLAQQRMSLKEQRARELTAILEQIKAHEEHSNELTECESNLMKWQQASEMYGKYVEVYIPKLLKRLNTIEDEDEELRLRESQEYVRRFENFTYAVEEAKAKREVQVDRMRLLQRSCVRNEEWADATLDPAKQQYSQRFAEANKEIDEVSSYLEYLHNIESDRKDEVEPILHQVIAYNTAMQGTMEANKYIAAQESVNKDHVEDGTRANEQVLPIQDHTQVESTNANINQKNAGTIMEAHHTDDASSQMPLRTRDQFTESQAPLLATMDHPIITARLIGIAHEEQYLQKHRALNENELSAAEDKRVSVRKSKAELDMMASRYNNVEAIKELLMKDLQSHKE